MPEPLLDRLRRLDLRSARRPPPPSAESVATASMRDLPGCVVMREDGPVHVATAETPRVTRHGHVAIDAALEARRLAAVAASRDPRFRAIDPERWLFIDTETTSLNSGAGVWVFMVGLGAFEDGAFRVRQFLLVDPTAERALLSAVHGTIAAAEAIVSFHGKSFDAPRLDDRFRLAGLAPLFVGRPHLDLLHPMRRLFGDRLPDCRLRTIEERLLGLRREDDLPGALCPEAYFGYLRGGPNRLAEVFEHNRLDVLSLSALSGFLAAAYDAEAVGASTLRVGLDWAEAEEHERAGVFLSRVAAAQPRAPASAVLAASRWLVRRGEADRAATLLRALAERDPRDPRPGLALKRIAARGRKNLRIPEKDGKLTPA